MSDVEKHGANGSYTHAPRPSNIANPAPLGLFSFASTTFILSLYNVGTRHIATPNVVVGMAIFTGGLAQLLAGMWEFPKGNAFGATAFTSYGAFWLSFAALYIPGSGILTAYTNVDELHSALGIYLITWFMFTFLMFLATLRMNIGLVALFGFLTMTFLMLAVGEFTLNAKCHKAGGGLGVVTALIAFYAALSGLLTKEKSMFVLPMGDLSN
jgi:succinate-acetate transporter protein